MANQPGAPEQGAGGQHAIAWSIASLMTQVGCVTLFFALAAIGAGLWLNSQLDTRPLFTVIFFLVSVPITFYVLIRLVLHSAGRLEALTNAQRTTVTTEEKQDGGREG